MNNPIIEKYSDVLVNYCLGVKPEESVIIGGNTITEPLIKAVYKQVMKAGGHPMILANIAGQDEIFYKNASEEQLKYQSPIHKFMIENVDNRISILGNFNTRENSNVDPKKMSIRSRANQELNKIFMERAGKGELAWNVCQYPTHADAQEAGMSLDEYADFVFKSCHLDKDDPVKYWKEFGSELERISSILEEKEELHIVSEDTDIRCKVKGRKWTADKGKENYPGGEVFTGPIEDTVEGKIRFSFPGIFQGKEIKDIRLKFEKGKVVEASAAKGEDLLKTLLDTDEGARYVGEVAVGCNKGITKVTRNMFFDEKIGGTVHLAIGRSYPETGGQNESTIHWDMLCDMKNGGQIFADDELIYEDGEFII